VSLDFPLDKLNVTDIWSFSSQSCEFTNIFGFFNMPFFFSMHYTFFLVSLTNSPKGFFASYIFSMFSATGIFDAKHPAPLPTYAIWQRSLMANKKQLNRVYSKVLTTYENALLVQLDLSTLADDDKTHRLFATCATPDDYPFLAS